MRHCSGNEFGPRLRVGHNDKDQVFTHKEDVWGIFGVDFSPDATRLAVASRNGTAVLLDVELGTQAHTLRHEGWVTAAKYAPQGDRIAAGGESVRIWGSNDGRFLVDIPVTVNPEYNAVLLWFGDHHLAVVSNSIIQRIDVYTGSAVSRNGPFQVEMTARALSYTKAWVVHRILCKEYTHAPLGRIQHPQDIHSLPTTGFSQLEGTKRLPSTVYLASL